MEPVIMTKSKFMNTPIGLIAVRADDDAILAIEFVDQREETEADSPLLERAVDQLEEYFQGARTRFSLPLAPRGTQFQQQVWQQLLSVNYGQTASYADIARSIGRPKAMRAVGAANGRNPISIVIPCHRVVGSDGSLTGYAGGLARKSWLLALETD